MNYNEIVWVNISMLLDYESTKERNKKCALQLVQIISKNTKPFHDLQSIKSVTKILFKCYLISLKI